MTLILYNGCKHELSLSLCLAGSIALDIYMACALNAAFLLLCYTVCSGCPVGQKERRL